MRHVNLFIMYIRQVYLGLSLSLHRNVCRAPSYRYCNNFSEYHFIDGFYNYIAAFL